MGWGSRRRQGAGSYCYGLPGIRPQAALHSSLVMWVLRSQRAKQCFGRLLPWPEKGLSGLPAICSVTVTEVQGTVGCAKGADAGAGGGVGRETGLMDAADVATSALNGGARITDDKLGSTTGCLVSVT